MKKRVLLIFILIICNMVILKAMDVNIGIKTPIAYGINSIKGYKNWSGLQYGAGIFIDVKFLSFLSAEVDTVYSRDVFYANKDEFSNETFQKYNNLRTTFLAKYWFSSKIYSGLGVELITQLSGTWGNKSFENEFTKDELGTDTYLTIIGGYNYKLSEKINFIGEIKGTLDLTIKDAAVFDIGGRIGVGYNFTL